MMPAFISLIAILLQASQPAMEKKTVSRMDVLCGNTWIMKKAMQDKTDVTHASIKTILFARDGSYSAVMAMGGIRRGTWEFCTNQTSITFDKGQPTDHVADVHELMPTRLRLVINYPSVVVRYTFESEDP